MSDKTTIQISNTNVAELKERGNMGQTMNDLISSLLGDVKKLDSYGDMETAAVPTDGRLRLHQHKGKTIEFRVIKDEN